MCHLEFYQLRSFVVVAQTQNLTKAAKLLYSTPSAVSAHIKNLEQELNTILFTRSSQGMALTDKGQQLLIKAQKTLDAAVDMVNLATESQHELIGEFNIGLNQSIEALKIEALITNIQENCPGISLNISHSSTGKIFDAILSGELDGGYVYGEIAPTFLSIAIKDVAMTTVIPKTYDINAIKISTDFKNYPWITMDKYCPFDQALTSALGENINSVISSSDEHSRLTLVKENIGISFLERELAHQEAKSLHISPLLDFTVPLSFVVARTKERDPIIKALLQEIRALWNIPL